MALSVKCDKGHSYVAPDIVAPGMGGCPVCRAEERERADLGKRLVNLAQELGATSVHLVYIPTTRKGGRWCILATWEQDGLVQFTHKSTPEDAISAAMKEAQGEHGSHPTGD